jgi:DNA-binding LacI/PurR family transcriptional regulator
LIIQGSVRQLSDPAILKRLKMAPAVVAVCPQAIENFPGDLVIHDRFEAICQVVDHFAATGRKRPVFLTEMSQEHNPPKYHAFAQRCEKHGIAHDNMLLSLHPVTDPDQMGMRHLSVFLERYPNTVEDIDSVFMFNDIGALYIMRELQQRGIDVPKQIAVVGFNDMETGRIWQPALATGNRKRDEVSNTIKQMLDTRLSQSDMPPQTQTVHMQFIYRESAG